MRDHLPYTKMRNRERERERRKGNYLIINHETHFILYYLNIHKKINNREKERETRVE